MTRRVYLAADHAGLELKEKIKRHLILKLGSRKIEIEDLGPLTDEPVDYPDSADKLCQQIHGFQLVPEMEQKNIPLPPESGILICGSGQGMAMRANRYPQIRAALCWNIESARLARSHNDANVLALGSRMIDHDLALEIVDTFMVTPFEGGRHLRRVLKLNQSSDLPPGLPRKK